MFAQQALDQLLIEIDAQVQAAGIELVVAGLAAIEIAELLHIAGATLDRAREGRILQRVVGAADLDQYLLEGLVERIQAQARGLIGNRQLDRVQVFDDHRSR